jgi:hypothetical protein
MKHMPQSWRVQMRFAELNFQPCQDGVQALVHFANGWTASVIQHSGSYGNDKGLYEIATINQLGKVTLTSATPYGVQGGLTERQVEQWLDKIAGLRGVRRDVRSL